MSNTVLYLTNKALSYTFRELIKISSDRAIKTYRVKGKVVPLRSIEAHLGDRRYSSCSFLTSALEGGEWSASRPGRALPPGKEPPVPTV
jgi:hypothetical protein